MVRLQNHKRQLELIKMEEKETINDFTTIITRLENQVKACGETLTKQYVVAKILGSLTPRFDDVVVAIEESKDLATMSKEEMKNSLEAHEKRMEEGINDKARAKIALQAHYNEMDKRSKGKRPMKSKGNFSEFWWKTVPKFQEFDMSKG